MKKTILGLLLTMLLCLMPSAFAEKEYTYSIDNMYFSDLYGNAVSEISNSCMVNITVSKNAYRAETDSIIIASYATDGELIGFSMMRGTTTTGTDTEFATLVQVPEGKELGIVKAYVWNSLSGMVPLAEMAENEVNKMLVIPQWHEKYIPDEFEICAFVERTPRSDPYLSKGTCLLSNVSCIYNYDDCYTAEQYNQKKERYNAIYEYHGIMEYGDPIYDLQINTNDIDMNEYLFQYLKFTIASEGNGKYTLKKITPTATNNIANLNLALVDDDKYTSEEILDALTSRSPYIYVYASENAARSSKYKLEEDFRFLVNGVEVDNYDDMYEQYIVNNTAGKLQLIDTYKSESGYDVVSVEYFDTTRVTSKSSKNIYIKKNPDGLNATSLSIDAEELEDEEITMNVYLNGEKVDPSEIKVGDVLSIKYDIYEGADSSFFDIFVSRDTAEGKFSGKDTEGQTITLGNKQYTFVEWWKSEEGFSTSQMGSPFKVFLDVFGRIYEYEISATTTNYAIALRTMTSSAWDNYGVKLFLADGTTANYEFATAVKDENGKTVDTEDVYSSLGPTNPKKADLVDRVVKYTINTQGKISKFTMVDCATSRMAEFDAKNSRIGSIIMSENTKIIYASDYRVPADLDTISTNGFVDDVEYEAYAYGTPLTTDNSYPFVLITMGEAVIEEEPEPETVFEGYAIALRGMSQSAWDNVGVKLFLADGTTANYEFATIVKDENGQAVDVDDLYDTLGPTNPKKDDLKDRVVKYKINSDNKITVIQILQASENVIGNFDAIKSQIGNIAISNSTKIINASDYSLPIDLNVVTIDALTNCNEYEVYAYGTPSSTDNSYPFILVTAGDVLVEEKPEVGDAYTGYGIALRGMSQSAWDNVGVKLFLADGTVKNYEFAMAVKDENGRTVDVNDVYDTLGTANPKKADLQDRVVKYTINTEGKISKITMVEVASINVAEFDARNSKIGDVIMNSTTTIIDASEYKLPADLTTATVDTLVDEVEYEVYAYGEPTDDIYPLVLITDARGFYNENTSFAVVTKDMYPSIKDDGEEGQMLEVLFEGSDEVQKLFVDEDAWYDEAYVGDVVVFQKDADGDLKEVKVIFSNPDFGTEYFSYESLVKFDEDIMIPTDDWDTAWISTKDMETSLVFGPIVERNGRKYLAQVREDKTYFGLEPSMGMNSSEGATMNIFTTTDTNVYVYDINEPRSSRFYVGTPDDIIATYVDHLTYLDGDYYTIDWSYAEYEDQINYAFAKVVDGVVTDIFVIVGIE